MSKFAIVNGKIFMDNHSLANGCLFINDGTIEKIATQYSKHDIMGYEVIDVEGNYVLPGFIDIHVNGGGNHLAIDCTDEALQAMAIAHGKRGTTSIIPTTISCTLDNLINTVTLISKYVDNDFGGAHILGSHLEGPFLNPKKGGAHKKEFLYLPSEEIFNKLYDASNGTLKIFSLAPELEGAVDIIKCASAKGVVVGFAHSEADYETSIKAINNGMNLCTHLFNGMQPITHRAPGAIGAFLTTPSTYVELIADGYHVHPATMEISIRANATGKTILVTDAVAPAGTNTNEFDILGTTLNVKGYSCFTSEGVLAGSALTLNYAVDILQKKTSFTFEEIIPMVTENPATLLGIFNRKGSLTVGKDADIAIMDKDMNVSNVFVGGKRTYPK